MDEKFLYLVKNYKTVRKLKSRVKESTFKPYISCLNQWFEWMSENGGEFRDYSLDDLVEFQKKASGEDRYKILDLIQAINQ